MFIDKLYSLLLICLVVCFPSVHANERTPIEVGISMSIPPWVIKETHSGIELDIIHAALDEKSYEIIPVYLPFERAYKLFDVGQLDIVMNAKEGVAKAGYLSEPVVTFQNYAISLAKKGFLETFDISRLSQHSVVAFQKAKSLLGEDFKAAVSNNSNYQEVAKQDLQVNLLFIRELDFIVMDKSIFGYFWRQAIKKNKFNTQAKKRFKQKVVFHPLFEPSPYRFIFKDKRIRDDFNKGLEKIKQNGAYDEILRRYDHLTDLYKPSS